jgi:hypothetical protein
MGVKVKGGMFCPQCDKPVAAQKGTARLRNTLGVVFMPVTGGASGLGTQVNDWHCPTCGGPVYQPPSATEVYIAEKLSAQREKTKAIAANRAGERKELAWKDRPRGTRALQVVVFGLGSLSFVIGKPGSAPLIEVPTPLIVVLALAVLGVAAAINYWPR